ncbi:MAG: ATPase [Promicromonosporaceae bacterium]|nr:ATPase [Promicromonosporaceae bacterium]
MSQHPVETVPDAIERTVDIDAPVERVWTLVSQPGWFINGGQIVEHVIERVSDDVVVVHDATVGRFRIQTVRLEPPTYAAFRWEAGERLDGDPYDGPTTLVEFFLAERPGGATVRVVESGFAGWGDDEARRRKAFDDNTEGWELEFAEAKRLLEQG